MFCQTKVEIEPTYEQGMAITKPKFIYSSNKAYAKPLLQSNFYLKAGVNLLFNNRFALGFGYSFFTDIFYFQQNDLKKSRIWRYSRQIASYHSGYLSFGYKFAVHRNLSIIPFTVISMSHNSESQLRGENEYKKFSDTNTDTISWDTTTFIASYSLDRFTDIKWSPYAHFGIKLQGTIHNFLNFFASFEYRLGFFNLANVYIETREYDNKGFDSGLNRHRMVYRGSFVSVNVGVSCYLMPLIKKKKSSYTFYSCNINKGLAV